MNCETRAVGLWGRLERLRKQTGSVDWCMRSPWYVLTLAVLTVISNRELIKVEKLIHQIDPECFMIVSRVSEVRGRGFSIKKEYQ